MKKRLSSYGINVPSERPSQQHSRRKLNAKMLGTTSTFSRLLKELAPMSNVYHVRYLNDRAGDPVHGIEKLISEEDFADFRSRLKSEGFECARGTWIMPAAILSVEEKVK
jgi:hypothetical protein